MAVITLDTCFNEHEGETIESVIAQFAAQHGVTGKVVTVNGPAGGWPIVEWTGTRGQITDMVLTHYANVDRYGIVDSEDAMTIMESVVD